MMKIIKKDKKLQSIGNFSLGAWNTCNMGDICFCGSRHKTNSRKHYAAYMADSLFVY